METSTKSIEEQINEWKAKRNAVILAHNYQRGEVQDIADLVGDSLELSQKAAKTDAEVIVFCGVHFMAETAKIISPEKTVLMPDIHAGCPMANMITLRELRKVKAEHPAAVVVCYVNSTAEIKAESDYCCTSGNAIKIVQSIPPNKEIIFIPDKSLGGYVSRELDRPMILWDGYCPTHHRVLARDIIELKKKHPEAKVIVHPECTEDVIAVADEVASTSGILRYCKISDSSEFIIGTELGMIHRLKKENPGKTFYPTSQMVDCPNMKLITVEKILWSLEDMEVEVDLPENIIKRAKRSIERMLSTI